MIQDVHQQRLLEILNNVKIGQISKAIKDLQLYHWCQVPQVFKMLVKVKQRVLVYLLTNRIWKWIFRKDNYLSHHNCPNLESEILDCSRILILRIFYQIHQVFFLECLQTLILIMLQVADHKVCRQHYNKWVVLHFIQVHVQTINKN